ncbi:hypothetical protein ELE36_12985 [Pseudolysobacter antarcticus]|uniref:Uncharacterized protein n=1 Tax=Pseudolysobacter antarcticus TaxID=2511995 RepID=A0A411HL21_9GAMM|nr:hypothetical protein [Pseudolysobacter antarcticus]QBB71193.1 hypothetical protein ELE36_12985 [Pseudolysobacter antarcticus]
MKNKIDLSGMLMTVAKFSACLLPLAPLHVVAQVVDTSFHNSNLRDGTLLRDPGSDAPLSFLVDESFDQVAPPVLPQGWRSNATNWQTVEDLGASSAPNAAHVFEPPFISDNFLFAPAFISVAHMQLRFKQRMDIEYSKAAPDFAYDGVVLEIAGSRNGPFFDIENKGGTFASGGYTHLISISNNPLAGRNVWSGLVPDYQDVVVNLPPSLIGCPLFVRWRMGTDGDLVGADGYYLDNVQFGVPNEYIFADKFEVTPQACL